MDQEKINAYNEQQRLEAEKKAASAEQSNNTSRITTAVLASNARVASSVNSNIQATKTMTGQISTVGRDILQAVSGSQDKVAEALNNLVVATIVGKDPQLLKTAEDLSKLLESIATASGKMESSKLQELPGAIERLTAQIEAMASREDPESEDEPDPALPILEQIAKSLSEQKTPELTVPAPVVNVDLSKLEKKIDALTKAMAQNKVVIPEINLDPVIEATQKTTDAISNIRFPIPNYVQDPFIRYKAVDEFDDGVAANIKYYGFIDPEGHWYIIKNDPSGSAKTYRYAFGGTDYVTNWTNRASLTYGLPFTAGV